MLAVPMFVFGAVLGSFSTALAHRLPRGENWVSDRSRCPECGAEIRARDNVPLISWLALRGHCRDCDASIPARYPLAEMTMASLFVVTYAVLGADPWYELALGLTLCTVLVTITLTDLEQRIIPNKVVLAGSIAAVAIAAIGDPGSLTERGIAALAGGGGLFLVVMAYPKGMGMGDAKLVGMMGLFLGKAVAPAILIGFALGALVGVAMMVRGGSAARKQAIPFGPFLAVGGVIGLLAGVDIVDWYVGEFFPSS